MPLYPESDMSRSFGRRGEPQRPLSPPARPIPAAAQCATVDTAERSLAQFAPLAQKLKASPADDDFEQWKRARRKNFPIPWRPLSFMASVFFGVASFVLPDSVTDILQWPLYGLSVASFWIGFYRRRQAKNLNRRS
jgi:hypothetical protein